MSMYEVFVAHLLSEKTNLSLFISCAACRRISSSCLLLADRRRSRFSPFPRWSVLERFSPIAATTPPPSRQPDLPRRPHRPRGPLSRYPSASINLSLTGSPRLATPSPSRQAPRLAALHSPCIFPSRTDHFVSRECL
jgi:hypothetical protein